MDNGEKGGREERKRTKKEKRGDGGRKKIEYKGEIRDITGNKAKDQPHKKCSNTWPRIPHCSTIYLARIVRLHTINKSENRISLV
jgi:hypothetical protein